jgi:hypothetical protein
MDDTFAFRSTGPLRRRVDPVALKAAFAAFVVVLAVGLFARWVIASERASELRTPEVVDVGVQTLDGLEPVAAITPSGPLPVDRATHRIATQTLAAARKLFGHGGTFADAGPAQLSGVFPGLTFTDGPSQTSSIVSVASTDDAWAAAVLSESGTCWLVRADAKGSASYGRSDGADACTGAAALEAHDPAWD